MTAGARRDDSVRLRAAFPESISADVSAALTMMPNVSRVMPIGSKLSPHSIGSNRRQYHLTVGGEAVDIPYRIYHDSPDPDAAETHPVQRTILGCIYTRHYDGFVRQQWLRTILDAEHPWVAPFVIQLLGEYVPEIIDDIDEALRARPAEPYERFITENPQFHTLIRQRTISYWNAYSRSRYPRLRDYPGYSLLGSLDQTSTMS
ncbi:hypothetical protein [Mycobacteroides abscessus]|uniref:hypothetical protein n=1 Tax=Mycobacteroides abscessus TaxID=36809 RepID=UPI00148F7544|nr:hypothetical protein [Mycobacteroides abscessus]